MHIEKHVFIDLDAKDISESLLLKLVHNRLYDYKDTILKEHIYCEVEGIYNKMQEQGVRMNSKEKRELADIGQLMIKYKAAYFRIIFP